MNRLVAPYLGPEFIYDFTQGPDEAPSLDQAAESGINCVSLAHMFLEEHTGYKLPPSMYCYEMFYSGVFKTIPRIREMRLGDIVWFGNPANGRMEDFIPEFAADGQMANWGECPVNHIGVFTGDFARHNDPIILHASSVEGTNVVQPLSAMARVANWSHVYGIKRQAV